MRPLQWWHQVGVVVLSSVAAAAPVTAETLDERVERLEQELRIVKRQLELRDEERANKAKEQAIVKAGAKDGFVIQSPDQAYQLKLRGVVHTDGRFFVDNEPAASTFTLRRVRPILEGVLARHVAFRVMPDFGGGSATLVDAYVDANGWREATLRAGKFKAPLSLERLQSITDDPFIEVGMPASSVLPNRDTGIQLFGDLWGGTVSYALSFSNGASGGASLDHDTEDDKDFGARLFARPFRQASLGALHGLGLGLATSIGHNEGALPSYRTVGQQTFFSYRADAVADGRRVRLVPQGSYYWGPLGVLGEYAFTSEDYRRANVISEIENSAWLIGGSYFLTGEENGYKAVTIRHPFDPAQGGWGAVELKVRYTGLVVDKDAFTSLASLASAAQRADEITVGANWHLNRHVKWLFDYGHTTFNGGSAAGDREDESVALTRLQLVY